MSELGTTARPLRAAIVGSGPSGFFAAEALFKADIEAEAALFDRLPVPFGLVRGGVAPDHVKIKGVTRVFERIASHRGFSFWGNVAVGRDISIEELRRHFDAVIVACGAETDRRLGIPGEDLAGSHTATAFVGWYNGHPDYAGLDFGLDRETAVIIGQGNVAVDVARILAKTPGELAHTDIAGHALDALARSKVRTIHMIGRRGPVQARFTPAELKELGQLDTCRPVVDPGDLELDALSQAEVSLAQKRGGASARNIRKNLDVLTSFAALPEKDAAKHIVFHFLKSPVRLLGGERVEGLELESNRLDGEPGNLRAVGTGRRESLPCGLVFRSVGYRGCAMPGLPFDEGGGLIPNANGRVVQDGRPLPGVYVTGWIKRGPSGIIGTNKPDSVETVSSLLKDVPSLAPCPEPAGSGLSRMLQTRGVRPVTFDEWRRLDEAEIQRGKALGKPREKFTNVAEMLAALEDNAAGNL